jgi:hypothetical protein
MSSLLNILTTNGSPYSIANGQNVPINPLSTKQSQLHVDGTNNPGYSIVGADVALVNSEYQQYDVGVSTPNALPQPSQLDLSGVIPPYNYRANTPEGRTF